MDQESLGSPQPQELIWKTSWLKDDPRGTSWNLMELAGIKPKKNPL